MTKLILMLAMMISASIQANETCNNFEGLAGEIMTARQGGSAASELIEVAGSYAPTVAMIHAAYQKPFYSSEESKKQAVLEFKNEMYLLCIKTLEGSKDE